MFGWWRRRRLKEQRKLFFQNSTAANVMIAYFTQENNPEFVALANKCLAENVRISRQHDGTLTSMEDLKLLLDINRTMRRMFDQTATSRIETFDNFIMPAGGWDRYYRIRYDD